MKYVSGLDQRKNEQIKKLQKMQEVWYFWYYITFGGIGDD